MIKVKIYELDKHRNETTFRPYLAARDVLKEVGIEITEGDSYDFAWIGQASISNKLLPLNESVEMGVRFCKSVGGDIMLFDGQDSHSLIGTYEVYERLQVLSSLRCTLLLKNTLLKSMEMYKIPTVNGRWYWGDGDYSIPQIDAFSDGIVLSGTNWLSTFRANFMKNLFHLPKFSKVHDVCALFGYPASVGYEHGLAHHQHYDLHRAPCIEILEGLKNIDVQMLQGGQRIPLDEYYRIMAMSKIVVSPLGYGEMTPRDLEAIGMGAVVIKPTLDHLRSEPWIYDEGSVYIGCRHDYSDLEEKIDFVLSNFENLRDEMYEYTVRKYQYQYGDVTRMPVYLHNLFTEKLKGIITHED